MGKILEPVESTNKIMSLVHMKMKCIHIDAQTVEYSIESCDFNDDMNWEKLCIVEIDLGNNSYRHRFVGRFNEEKIIPPYIYGLNEDEQAKQIETRYAGFGYGAWSMRINNWITQFIHERVFPEEYPK